MLEPTFGERLRAHRERSGKTRAVLAGLVGRSAEWVKAVETGRLHMPRLPMLIRIADVLGIDVADLTGDPTLQVSRVSWGQLPAIDAIREALYRRRITPSDMAGQPVSLLRARVAAAWQIWHESRTRRTDVCALLPSLLADCQDAALSRDGDDRRAAHAALSDVCHLAQHALVNAAERRGHSERTCWAIWALVANQTSSLARTSSAMVWYAWAPGALP